MTGLTRPATADMVLARRRRPARRVATLRVHDTPDVFVRVITTLRRRHCEILSVDYQAKDRHRPGRFVVVYEPPPRQQETVRAWLGNLVDVLAVDDALA